MCIYEGIELLAESEKDKLYNFLSIPQNCHYLNNLRMEFKGWKVLKDSKVEGQVYRFNKSKLKFEKRYKVSTHCKYFLSYVHVLIFKPLNIFKNSSSKRQKTKRK